MGHLYIGTASYIYIYLYLGKLLGPQCDLTGIMVNKGNHPQMAMALKPWKINQHHHFFQENRETSSKNTFFLRNIMENPWYFVASNGFFPAGEDLGHRFQVAQFPGLGVCFSLVHRWARKIHQL